MKIKLLDASVANKIAAGEVVERPASIVKELVENSIDAGASNITVEIKDGGISFIRITDNGIGMEEEDVKNAFLRHATSKISVAEDLNDIVTLGFRGEALPSISAVSRVSLSTRTKNSNEGTQIELTGGVIERFFPCGCAEGTTIIVEDLFFNTPARRKFLKRAPQEASYVFEAVNRLALSNPEISLRYVQDGKTLLRTPGDNNLLSAIRAVFGADVSKNMIQVNETKDGITLKGFIGKAEIQRNNRSRQILFVNGRSVKNDLVSSAILQGYQGRLNIGKFPFFVLEMNVAGFLVDVNVHPTKQEVRFAESLPVYDTVSSIISKVLRDNQEIPSLFDKKEEKEEIKIIEVETVLPKQVEYTPTQSVKQTEFFKNVSVSEIFKDAPLQVKDTPNPVFIQETFIETKTEEIKTETKQEEILLDFSSEYKITGVLFDTYIVIEQNDDCFIIDQHAAHERLLFERLNSSMQEEGKSQILLFPQLVKLSPKEFACVVDLMPELNKMGFVIDDMGFNTLAIKEVPEILSSINAERFLSSLEENVKNVRTSELKRNKLMQMACKSAVKGGDKLTESDITLLLKLIKEEGVPLTCPHGRPILIRLTKHELEVRFKRIQ